MFQYVSSFNKTNQNRNNIIILFDSNVSFLNCHIEVDFTFGNNKFTNDNSSNINSNINSTVNSSINSIETQNNNLNKLKPNQIFIKNSHLLGNLHLLIFNHCIKFKMAVSNSKLLSDVFYYNLCDDGKVFDNLSLIQRDSVNLNLLFDLLKLNNCLVKNEFLLIKDDNVASSLQARDNILIDDSNVNVNLINQENNNCFFKF